MSINELHTELEAAMTPLAKTLLLHVVRGEEALAKIMIEKNPELLYFSGTVTDYSNRTHENRTALQLALGAQDADMAEMIVSYLKNLPNGESTIVTQIRGQFPNGYEIEEEKRVKSDISALSRVHAAIAQSSQQACADVNLLDDRIQSCLSKDIKVQEIIQSILKAKIEDHFETAFNKLRVHMQIPLRNLGLLKEIYKFRNYLEPKKSITFGKYSNSSMLIKIFQLYEENYFLFGSWNSNKNNLIWRKIKGYIERYLTANLAQAASQGFFKIIRCGEKLNRSFLINGYQNFFPLDTDPCDRLGFDYSIDCGKKWSCGGTTNIFEESMNWYCERNNVGGEWPRRYIEQNDRRCRNLCDSMLHNIKIERNEGSNIKLI